MTKTMAFVPWLLLCAAPAWAADTVYKCTGTDGITSFQSRPCSGSQTQKEITIKAPPPPPIAVAPVDPATGAPPPNVDPNAGATPPPVPLGTAPLSIAPSEPQYVEPTAPPPPPTSYECHAGDGAVFYRHFRCPSEVRSQQSVENARNPVPGQPIEITMVPVTEVSMPRADVCLKINARDAATRMGHEMDDRVAQVDLGSTVDPCR